MKKSWMYLFLTKPRIGLAKYKSRTSIPEERRIIRTEKKSTMDLAHKSRISLAKNDKINDVFNHESSTEEMGY